MKHSYSLLSRAAAFCCLLGAAFPAFGQYLPNRYALFLADPPVSQRFTARSVMGTTAAVNYRRQIESRQQTVLQELGRRGVQVTGSVSTLLNAIFVTAGADRLDELKALDGVVDVVPMRRGKMNLSTAVALVNAPAAWTLVGGQSNAGAGIKIGILDTGIDSKHPAFQDSSMTPPAGFPKCFIGSFSLTGAPTACSDPTLYTNSKVIVARSYVPQLSMGSVTNTSNPAAQSQPDDFSPADHIGHGTAVASAAAGALNSGGTVQFSGVAPKAYLGSYKVYGSPGVNDYFAEDVVIQAINDAFNDGMDVVNFSSGFPTPLTGPLDAGAACGLSGSTPCDPIATAFENAVKSGLVVTVSAGNAGVFNGIGSPAIAPSVLAVGATMNSHTFGPSVSVAGSSATSSLKNVLSTPSDSYLTTTGAITAPLVDAGWVGDPYACTAFPANTSLSGAIALVQRNASTDANLCSFYTKATVVQNAGAVGMILYNTPDNRTWNSTRPTYNYIESVYTFTGPVVGLSNADGLSLKQYIDATALATYAANPVGNPWPQVTIDYAGATQGAQAPSNYLAYYSSLGPAMSAFPCSGCSILKPDLVATGGGDPSLSPDYGDVDSAGNPAFPGFSGMYLAAQTLDPAGEMYSSTGYIASDGTSFSAPLVAGAAALVKQAHPGYTADQIKSALVNTANLPAVPLDDFQETTNILWTGAGLLDAGAAAGATVVAKPATVSFGVVRTTDALPSAQTVTITNLGSSAASLSLSVSPQRSSTVASVTVDKTTLNLGAAGSPTASATLSVSLTGSTPASAGLFTGNINITGASATFHIPYVFMVGSNSVGSSGSVTPLYGTYFDVYPGQDVGAIPVQLEDFNGAPVSGSSVIFCVSNSSGSCQASSSLLTLKNATSSASPSNSGAFSPGATPCSALTAVAATCATNSFGVAYISATAGSTTGSIAYIAVKLGGVTQAVLQVYIRPQPTIAAALDAAKGQSTIAPGSYVAIYGSGLSDYTAKTTAASLPMSLDGVTVSFDVPSANISLPGRLMYVSPTQVNVQVPWELQGLAAGTKAQMKVSLYEFEYGQVYPASLAEVAPALYEYSIGGATNVAATTGNFYTFVSSSSPAQKGKTVSLYATGLGPVNNQPTSGSPASSASATPSSTKNAVTVTIGGQPATVSYAGLHPGTPGLYRVDVTVPSGAASGAQTVSLSVSGQTATSTLYIQ